MQVMVSVDGRVGSYGAGLVKAVKFGAVAFCNMTRVVATENLIRAGAHLAIG
jgi:hypothetical protein